MNRKIITSLVALLVVAAVVAGGVYYYQKNIAPPKNLITSVNPGLTDAEKQNIQSEIDDSQNKLNASDDQGKYKLYLTIGADNFRLGKFQESLDAYLAAAKLFPDNSVPLGEAANVEFSMNNLRDAEKHIQQALKLNPSSQTFKDLLQKIQDKLKTAQ